MTHHDFADRLAAALVGGLDQHLRDHGDQALRQEALGLLALVGGQRVDDAVDGLHRAGRVQRAEHQVTGFGRRHRPADRVGIAQLADQDDVGIFAHRRAHAFGERGQVRVELALDDLALLALVHELDRIFEADDVHPPRRVQVIDHRGQRRRLAGAGRAGDQDHALVVVAQLLDDGRQRPADRASATSVGIARKVAPMPVSLRNTLTRKRPPLADTYEKSTS